MKPNDTKRTLDEPEPPDGDELFYMTELGKTPRDPEKQKDYILFIDLGSYRTSVLCWPTGEDREIITDASEYVIAYGDEEHGIGFPSAFIIPLSTGRRAAQQGIKLVNNLDQVNVPRRQLVESAKRVFARDFAKSGGEVPFFLMYMKKVIEESLTYITEPSLKRKWNDDHIPHIAKVRVTVPDLFVENLRKGYCERIKQVCRDLAQFTKWKQLLPTEPGEDFVTVSSDESGACELYFLNLIKEMPFWDLSDTVNREAQLAEVEHLFAQKPSESGNRVELTFALCHLDIGGLTTDATIVLLGTRRQDRPPIITSTLRRKESFAEKKAGEDLKRDYESYRERHSNEDANKKWWESEGFVGQEFSDFLKNLLFKQYTLLKRWKNDMAIDGIYYLVSGRPTRAPLVQTAIVTKIMEIFNRDELLLLPEHCLFMASYRHVAKTDRERYSAQIPNFEKLVTILGNVYTLYDGWDVDSNISSPGYYVSLLGYRGAEALKILPEKDEDTKEWEDFEHALKDNESVRLAFSKNTDGTSTTHFLTVKRIPNKPRFPKLKVPSRLGKREWIIPSLEIINLKEDKEAFELGWF